MLPPLVVTTPYEGTTRQRCTRTSAEVKVFSAWSNVRFSAFRGGRHVLVVEGTFEWSLKKGAVRAEGGDLKEEVQRRGASCLVLLPGLVVFIIFAVCPVL